MTPAELKEARQKLGFTQKQLAAEIGTTATTVARWEQEVHPVPLWATKAIALLLRPG